jgi:hypothetical protein
MTARGFCVTATFIRIIKYTDIIIGVASVVLGSVVTSPNQGVATKSDHRGSREGKQRHRRAIVIMFMRRCIAGQVNPDFPALYRNSKWISQTCAVFS